jgi:hypothetical protein
MTSIRAMAGNPPYRTSVVVRLFAGAAVLVVGALVRMWFGSRPVSAGLWGVEVCDHGCHGVRWDDIPGADLDLILAGYTGTVASLLAAGLLVATAWSQLAGKRGPIRATRTVVTIALVAMLWFVARMLLENADLNVLAVLVPGLTIGTWFTLRSA